MTERHGVKENLTAALILLVLFGGIFALIWVVGKNPKQTPRHNCPYCGQEIKVKLEPNGEKK